ncbi:MAG: 1,4-alpha-glucan branching protein GlgB [Pseudomonadota bacterium]
MSGDRSQRTTWTRAPADEVARLVDGRHDDPFALLGPKPGAEPGRPVVRSFQPDAVSVAVVDGGTGRKLASLERTHDVGFFEGPLDEAPGARGYRLRVAWPTGDEQDLDDPYRFPLILGALDMHLLAEGRHLDVHEKLGAQPTRVDGVDGTTFAVWAPSAQRVSVVGDFNRWDGRRHPMRHRVEAGIWELFVPELGAGETYKFEILGATGVTLPLKADPVGLRAERSPGTASVVNGPVDHGWADETWMHERAGRQAPNAPVSIYEVHLGSWGRVPEEGDRYLTYEELAEELVRYVRDMGFTHIQLLPVSEHPFDGSWGYQPLGLFAPTSRFGPPAAFAAFVDRCHQAGIGVLLDWVPGHFPTDPHGLGRFDGTALYEHEDPRQGFHQDWNTLIYNYGRNEVANYLLSNGLYWCSHFHIDGLRVDAVASMLYLDYSRPADAWIPNRYGGNENLEAVDFLRRLTQLIDDDAAGAITIAEESTAWPGVTRASHLGGLGFDYKWNMGWMHDTLNYMRREPIYRKHHQHDLTFGLLYAFSENFVLPLSHDEVVHGKGSLLNKMPGDSWRQFANLRAYFGFMWTHPGKKLLFMGGEFAQRREWNHDRSLDWHLLDDPQHDGVRSLVRDLNEVYCGTPALHERDADPGGFEWIDATDTEQSVISFMRHGSEPGALAVVVCNFTPTPRDGYRVGVPVAGGYRERINTDATQYGGSGIGNAGWVEAEDVPWHGRPCSLRLSLPPLATLVLEPAAH